MGPKAIHKQFTIREEVTAYARKTVAIIRTADALSEATLQIKEARRRIWWLENCIRTIVDDCEAAWAARVAGEVHRMFRRRWMGLDEA